MIISSALQHLKFIRKKPRVIPRIIHGYWWTNTGRPVLRTVDWSMTYKCNANCVFCSAANLMRNKQELTVDQIKDVWDRCRALGAVHVNLTGGEPLCRDENELVEIIEYFNRYNDILVSLVTNGILIDFDNLYKFKDAGLDTLQVSLDSPIAEEHDRLRGIACYHKAVRAAVFAGEMGLNVCVNMVLTRFNVDDARGLADICKKEGWFLTVNLLSMAGKGDADRKLGSGIQDTKIFDDILNHPAIHHDTSFNFSGRRECPGGRERIYITHGGEVQTCPHVQISYGNVLETDVAKIWYGMLGQPAVRYRSRYCKHAFDRQFYEEYLMPLEDHESFPVRATQEP